MMSSVSFTQSLPGAMNRVLARVSAARNGDKAAQETPPVSMLRPTWSGCNQP